MITNGRIARRPIVSEMRARPGARTRPPLPAMTRLLACGALLAGSLSPAHAVDGEWISHLYMNEIRDIAVAGDGIWCATTGGALFYDFALGRFRAWNRSAQGLASDSLTAVAVLDDGRVAFGTEGAGVSIYDPDRGQWSQYTSLTWPIAGDVILGIVEIPPWRVIGSRGGFVAWNDGEVREACQQGLDICGLPGWNISAAATYRGGLWLGSLATAAGEGGVSRLDLATGVWQTLNAGALTSRPEVVGLAVWQDSLYCAYGGGVAVWDGGRWAPRTAGLPGYTNVRDLCAGPRHLLIAAAGTAATAGVYQWDPAARAWTRLGTQFAQCVAEGEDGVIWAGTGVARTQLNWLEPDADGLWAYVAGEWIQQRHPSPHPMETYRDLAVDGEGRLWAALAARGKGWKIARFDTDGWSFFDQTNTSLNNSWVYDLRIVNGDVWAGHCCCADEASPCYLNEWDPVQGTVAVHDSIFNIYTSTQDERGDLWFGSWSESPAPAMGLYHLDAETGVVRRYTTANTGGRLPSDRISDLAFVDGELWIGTQAEGVARCMLDPYGLPILEDWAWRTYTSDLSPQPVPSNYVRAMAAQPGEVWVGTTAGVSVFRNNAWRIFHAGPFGLPSGEVTDIALTTDGAAWIAMRAGGVARITRDESGAYAIERFAPPELINLNATTLAVGSGGRDVWVGTDHGLAHFVPASVVSADAPAQIDVFPNPYNPACAQPLKLVQLPGRAMEGTIADVSGRVVARFDERWSGEAIWNGRDLDGHPVAPGCYVIRASTARGWLTGRVAVLDLPCDGK